jgi:AcrR family transcriptional regulator
LDKKQEIKQAAFELFGKRGYHLSMSELAGAVGIKTPSLYSHFSGKDQILELVIQEEIERYFGRLCAGMDDAANMNCKDSMESLFLFVMEYFSELSRLRFWRMIPLISNEPLRDKCSRLIAQQDAIYNERMRGCFLKGIQNKELRSGIGDGALYLYLVMIQGVLDGMLLHPKAAGDKSRAIAVFRTYWEGVRAMPE